MSHSRPPSQSRPQSAHQAQTHLDYQEGLIYPEGSVLPEETVHLLHEAEGRPSPTPSEYEDPDAELWHMLPWWKRPSPTWMLFIVPFTVIAMASTLAPKVEVYTTLVCQVFKPEYFADVSPTIALGGGNSLCAADPVVRREVALLTTVLTTTMGILSCLTAGWWGLYSDCKGRTRVLGVTVWGLLLNDVLLIFVFMYAQWLPGNYWWLVLGSVVEGILGGTPGGIAAVHAYVADTTQPSHRSRVFSLSLGLTFMGMALGPTIGSLLIRLSQKAISVFYLATAIHVTYALMMWFIVPESLTKSRMLQSLEKYHEDKKLAQIGERGTLYYTKKVFGFLTPLNVFAPIRVFSDLSKPRWDWTLFLVIISYAFNVILQASYSYKFQYASGTFGWSSETLGYWLTLIGSARAIYLALILPVIIKIFNKSTRSTHDHSRSRSPRRTDTHSSTFDLGLARASLCVEVITYLLIGIYPNPAAFTGGAFIASFGSGYSPAIQAVALEVYTEQGGTESGRLFGAISVIQALFSQVIGPSLFGMVYMSTVATFSRAIFFLCAAMQLLSLTSLAFVRLRKMPAVNVEDRATEEDPLLNHD